MELTLTIDDIATFDFVGDVALATGTADNGDRVTFAGNPRALDALAQAIMLDEEAEVAVDVEESQGGYQQYPNSRVPKWVA